MQGKTELASQYFACPISCLLLSGNGVADQEQSPARRPPIQASPRPIPVLAAGGEAGYRRRHARASRATAGAALRLRCRQPAPPGARAGGPRDRLPPLAAAHRAGATRHPEPLPRLGPRALLALSL